MRRTLCLTHEGDCRKIPPATDWLAGFRQEIVLRAIHEKHPNRCPLLGREEHIDVLMRFDALLFLLLRKHHANLARRLERQNQVMDRTNVVDHHVAHSRYRTGMLSYVDHVSFSP
jgi:hypothetical protein